MNVQLEPLTHSSNTHIQTSMEITRHTHSSLSTRHTHLSPVCWPTGCRPVAFTHSRSNMRTNSLAHAPDQTRRTEGERQRCWERRGRDSKRGRRGLKAERKSGHGGSEEEEDKAGVVTLGGAWRACSLKRTSRRCCRTPSPSGGPLEPCSHECRCDKHTTATLKQSRWNKKHL